jgi:hypothetical protein
MQSGWREPPVYLDSDSNGSVESLEYTPPPTYRPTPSPVYGSPREGTQQLFIPGDGAKPPGTSGRVTPEPNAPENAKEPNLNRRYDYLPESMVPFWYLKNPPVAPEGTRQYLCGNCRRIDLLGLFKQREVDIMPKPRDYIVLGTLMSILDRNECGFCSLVARIIVLDTGTDLPRDMPEEERKSKQKERINELLEEIYYLCPIRFETTFKEPALYICSNKDVTEAAKKTTVQRPRRSMAIRPLHKTEPNLGRILLNPDQIDFEWIRGRMKMCDERDVGKLSYRHEINVRAIDVHEMRIVDLDHGERYVTLSYTWGDAGQLLLQRHMEAEFRSPGGFNRFWDRIPKTIQDAIKLVREIGEQYIWVDALCIVQDDPEDMHGQIGEMGNIYKNSILTICACCGEGADYGLPGIEPGTRKGTRQVAEIVGNFVIGNALPDSESLDDAKWNTRGWTLQEKVLSQRKLQITDNCVRWWCWHTTTAEDENCRHPIWQPGTAHRGMYFFKTEHDLLVSKIHNNSNMDIYAFIVSDYTARNLTHQSDAAKAVTGVLNAIDGLFRGEFVMGLPDTELSAALLWVPLGQSRRRVDSKTGMPLFPSWSWLGWIGHVAYPWLVERSLPMSEDGSPLFWRNTLPNVREQYQWFTGDEYRGNISASSSRWEVDERCGWTYIDSFSESHRWLHPVAQIGYRDYNFFANDSRTLRLRTLSATFTLEQKVRTRKEKHDYLHTVNLVRVLDQRGFCAGYIYHSDVEFMTWPEQNAFLEGPKEFIVLSRASTNPDPRIGRELLHSTPISELHSVYSMAYLVGAMSKLRPSDGDDDGDAVNPDVCGMGHFDTRLYDATTPWGLFNVMMIHSAEGVSQRVAIGRIHVAAFMEAEPTYREIVLE